MLKRLLAGAVLVLFAGQADGEIITGNGLVEYMREVDKHNMGHPSAEYFGVGFYSGFVAAAYDAYDSAGLLCTSGRVTLGQAMAIVSRYFKANPTKWHLPAVDLVREALLSAFPCPK
jgi:hypothetical protein